MLKRKHALIAIIILSVLFVSNCASVKVLDKHGKKVKGFMYYQAKPYLVIENTEKGKVIKLISIPDIRDPRYIKYERGWGKVDFSFKLDNGILVEFGQQTSTYIPETVVAVGGVVAGVGGIAAGLGTLATGKAALTAASKVAGANETDKITLEFKTLQDAAKKIENDIKMPLVTFLEKNEDDILEDILKDLTEIIGNLGKISSLEIDRLSTDILAEIEKGKKNTLDKVRTSIIPDIEEVLKKLNKRIQGVAELQQKKLHSIIQTTIIKVDDILGTLKAFSKITSPLQIFEIIEENYKLKFRQINIENM